MPENNDRPQATPEQLKDRWETDDGKERLVEIIGALKRGESWATLLEGFPYAEEIPNGRDLRGADLHHEDLADAHLRHTALAEANLSGARLFLANLRGSDLRGAVLSGAELGGATLSHAQLSGAELINAELGGADLTRADLAGAGMRNAQLHGATLADADLSGANLSGADLGKADLSDANLSGARLVAADLTGAEVCDADLCGADLTGADLCGARVWSVKLHEPNGWGQADLSDARFDRRTSFLHTDISRTNWSGNPLLKRHIEDQQWLQAWRNSSPSKKYLYWMWLISCVCGRSFSVWALWSLGLMAAFGLLFLGPLNGSIEIDPGLTGDRAVSAFTYFYYSIVTFTTLGFGDITPSNWLGEAAVILEVIIGYVMLGGLISIFANKLARRA